MTSGPAPAILHTVMRTTLECLREVAPAPLVKWVEEIFSPTVTASWVASHPDCPAYLKGLMAVYDEAATTETRARLCRESDDPSHWADLAGNMVDVSAPTAQTQAHDLVERAIKAHAAYGIPNPTARQILRTALNFTNK